MALRAGETITRDVTLQTSAQALDLVVVSASPRMNETTAQALAKQKNADNIVSVLSGDVIRALPNANAAEAAARIPGVSTERDEGEGKFVQIRGTEPRLSNVTVNGVHIPGTQSGSRVTKLDDVPTDILGAIEGLKDAERRSGCDAIGGLNPHKDAGARRAGTSRGSSPSTLEERCSRRAARWGPPATSASSACCSVAPGITTTVGSTTSSWRGPNAKGAPIPSSGISATILRRTRWGANAALDYRFDDGRRCLRGAWSRFKNFGVVYKYDIAATRLSQASSGARHRNLGATPTRNTSTAHRRAALQRERRQEAECLSDVSYTAS